MLAQWTLVAPLKCKRPPWVPWEKLWDRIPWLTTPQTHTVSPSCVHSLLQLTRTPHKIWSTLVFDWYPQSSCTHVSGAGADKKANGKLPECNWLFVDKEDGRGSQHASLDGPKKKRRWGWLTDGKTMDNRHKNSWTKTCVLNRREFIEA